MGGVGNRLFQAARALDLKRRGFDPVIVDVEELKELDYFARKILGWTQHPLWIDMVTLYDQLGLRREPIGHVLRLKLYSELLRARILGKRNRLNLPLEIDNRTAQIGYFQSPGCITSESLNTVAEAVYRLLPIANQPAEQTVLHLRAGDFAAEDRLSEDSVARFLEANGGSCFCVTNDPCYVRRTYPTLVLPLSGGPVDDFITLCRAKLIMPSNSTFCFWACVIAVRKFGALLWKQPSDPYWHHLDGYSVQTHE